jgi:outer membrane protein TolC
MDTHFRGSVIFKITVIKGALSALVAAAGSLGSAQGLSVRDAIAAGLKNNPLIEAARQDVQAARANVGLARSRKGLQLSANTFITGGNQQSILQSSMVEPRAFMMTQTDFFVDQNLMLMLPLYTGGMLEGMIAAAEQEERAASGEAQEVSAEVALRVTEAYYKSLYQAQLVDAERARVTANEEMVRTTRARFEAGKDIEASVSRAQAEVAEARRDLTTAENNRRKSLLDLQRAMAVELTGEVAVGESLALGTNPYPSVAAAIEKSRTTRGMVLAAQSRVKAAEGELRSAQGSTKPQIYGQAMGDLTNQSMMRGGATVGITLSIPLFDAGQRRSEISRSRSMVAKAHADLKNVQLDVENEIRQAWLDVDTAAANAESARAQIASAEAAYSVVALRVAAGKGILVEQLDALQALHRARAMLAEALFMHQESIAMLRRAVGEGM